MNIHTHHEEKVEVDAKWRDAYEVDLGEHSIELSGTDLEREYLYPHGCNVPLPSEPMMHRLRKEDQMDTRPRLLREEGNIDEALERNPYRSEPWKPRTKWLSQVQYAMCEQFGLYANDDAYEIAKRQLYLVPCLATKADILRGTDCFAIHIDPATGRRTIATIDIASSDLKLDRKDVKSDLVVTPTGIYVHPDMDVAGVRGLYSNPGTRKIDDPHVRERRYKTGYALAEILKYKMTLSPGLPHFRLPGEYVSSSLDTVSTRRRLGSLMHLWRRQKQL